VSRLPRPVWVIAVLLTAALLMASGVVGGTGGRGDPAWTAPLETRADEAGPREAKQSCPASTPAGARDA
jgi:hypothetical protein